MYSRTLTKLNEFRPSDPAFTKDAEPDRYLAIQSDSFHLAALR
jgi:hypothetical protein